MQQIRRVLIAPIVLLMLFFADSAAEAQLSSFESAKAGCESAGRNACMTLGKHYLIKDNLSAAVEAYRTACLAGEPDGCFRVVMYAPHTKPKQAMAGEIERLRQDCLKKDAVSCFYMGEIYQAAGPDPKWATAALHVYEVSCNELYGEGCRALGTMYARGEKVKEDVNKANSYYARGCKLQSAKACAIMGDKMMPNKQIKAMMGVTTGDMVQARKYYQQAIALYKSNCDRGDGLACNSLAAMYKNGEGVPASLKQAVIYWKKSCDLGERGICVFYEANRAKVGL